MGRLQPRPVDRRLPQLAAAPQQLVGCTQPSIKPAAQTTHRTSSQQHSTHKASSQQHSTHTTHQASSKVHSYASSQHHSTYQASGQRRSPDAAEGVDHHLALHRLDGVHHNCTGKDWAEKQVAHAERRLDGVHHNCRGREQNRPITYCGPGASGAPGRHASGGSKLC